MSSTAMMVASTYLFDGSVQSIDAIRSGHAPSSEVLMKLGVQTVGLAALGAAGAHFLGKRSWGESVLLGVGASLVLNAGFYLLVRLGPGAPSSSSTL